MKLTKTQLKRIIKEELARELKEERGEAEPAYGPVGDVAEALKRIEQNQQHIMHTLGQILNKP
jgi:precorrin-6x reductase